MGPESLPGEGRGESYQLEQRLEGGIRCGIRLARIFSAATRSRNSSALQWQLRIEMGAFY